MCFVEAIKRTCGIVAIPSILCDNRGYRYRWRVFTYHER